MLNLDHSEMEGYIYRNKAIFNRQSEKVFLVFLVFFCTYRNKWYLTWIKFRMDKSSRFLRFYAKTVKLNPREMYKNLLARKI